MSRTPSQPVPPLQCKTVFEKGSERQRFGEHISHLILCGNWMHGEVLANVGPEEVEFSVDVFGLRSTVGIHCNLQEAVDGRWRGLLVGVFNITKGNVCEICELTASCEHFETTSLFSP